MTSIKNFGSGQGLTETILRILNRIHDAKLSGALREDELANVIMLLSKLFSNLVKLGTKGEDAVSSFEALIPSGDYPFARLHKYLREALSSVTEDNTFAFMKREARDQQSRPVSPKRGFMKI